MPHRFVPFRVTVCGIEELEGHCEARVSHVLSILDPEYPVPPAFGAFGEHERLELRFHDVIEEGEGWIPPQEEHVRRILELGRHLVAEPRTGHLLVHCHAGVSRSTAALTMILAQSNPVLPAGQAMAAVAEIRPQAWPNLRMMEMADRLLGRNGDLVAAAHGRYRTAMQERPTLGQYMRDAGRMREVEAGGGPL
jgi:predicted protein tyrosine phosphatase